MRLDIGAKFVPAKKNVAAAEESVTFAFEVEVIGQPRNLVAVLFHPVREVRRFARAFFVPEITGNELATDGKPGVSRENHVGESPLRGDQMNLAIQFGKRRVQFVPLLLCKHSFGAARATHPRIDLVLDPVIVRRTKEQLAHKISSQLLFRGPGRVGFGKTIGEFAQERVHVCDQADGLQRLMLHRSLHC